MKQCAGKVLAVLVVPLLLLSGTSKDAETKEAVFNLDRESALVLLKRAGLNPLTYEIPVGENVNLNDYIRANKLADQYNGKIIDNSYGCLQKLKYLNFTPRKKNLFGSILTWYDISMTDQGRTIGTVVAKEREGYHYVYVFKVCDRLIKRVTGIKITSATSAVAEFEWQEENLNEVYRCMFLSKPHADLGEATLGKYDDGWRVESTQHWKGRR